MKSHWVGHKEYPKKAGIHGLPPKKDHFYYNEQKVRLYSKSRNALMHLPE